MQASRPRRSALYMPGSNARALEKARTLPADVVILDLEDAVAPDAKPAARQQVAAAVRAGGFGARETVIRINGLDTPWGADDLAAAAAAGPDAILVPKVGAASDIDQVSQMLNRAGGRAETRLWAMMETPKAMLAAAQIAAAAGHPGSRLSCFVLGTNDLAKETRASLGLERFAMMPWLMTCLAAARANGLEILDGVYNDFKDRDGLERESQQGRAMGMDGKTVIHPDQIATVNAVFSPAATEVASAEKIIAAFDLPENKGKGVITVDGRMVELLHAEMARRTLAIAAAIQARSSG
ncbi:MAG: CoA ester lyase [Hyphomicrobiaceae bacterium]